MGTTHSIGIGYGITYERRDELAEAIEEAIDIEFLLADEYPLLTDHHSGNAWSGNLTTFIMVDSTVSHDYSFLIEINDFNTSIDETGLNELKTFCERFSIPFKPSWKVFSYMG